MTARIPHFPRGFVSSTAILLAGAALFLSASTAPLPATPIAGNLVDVSLSPYGGPVNSLQFKPFAVAIANGSNTIWPATVYMPSTNGVFGGNLAGGGWYYASPVLASIFGPSPRPIPIFVPQDTNVWSFNACANLANFLAANGLTNPVVGLAPGTNVTFTVSNGVTYVHAGGSGTATNLDGNATNQVNAQALIVAESVVATNTPANVLTNGQSGVSFPNILLPSGGYIGGDLFMTDGIIRDSLYGHPDNNHGSLMYRNSSDTWVYSTDGGSLTNLQGSNVVGAVPVAMYATTAGGRCRNAVSAGQANVGLNATFYVTNTAVGQNYSSDDPMLFALMDSYYGNYPLAGWSLLAEPPGFATCYNMYLGYVGSYPYASGTIGENGLQGYIFNQHVIGISGDNRMAVSIGNLYGSGGVDGGQVELLARRNASASYLGGWLYADGIKYDGYSRVQIGNNPQSEHTLWYPGHAYLDLRTGGENTVPAFLFRDEAMVDTPVPGALERGLDGDLYFTRGNGDRVNIATNAQTLIPGLTTNMQFTFGTTRTNTLWFTNGLLMRVSQP